MRVISGKARGTRLETIEGLNTRPTTDRIKESIFNLIQFDIPEAKVLDLFSGSGALGLEAASRGASTVTLVEQNRRCHKVIEENIQKCGMAEQVRLVKGEVISALGMLDRYDVVIMDPPYHKELIIPVLEGIVNSDLLEEDGIVLVEHHRDDVLPEKISNLVRIKEKKYGITKISIYSYDG